MNGKYDMKNRTLERFLKAQTDGVYDNALAEIKSGQKRSHWMWFVFPRLDCLGMSEMSRYYGIKDVAEAREYLADSILGGRFREICGELLKLPSNNPYEIFGSPDAMI